MPHEKSLKAISHAILCSTPGHMETTRATMKAKNAATPLCYVEGTDGKPLGHMWENTTSASIHFCSRCKLVQYKTKTGHWKNATSLKHAKSMVKQAVQIGTLWSTLDEGETEE